MDKAEARQIAEKELELYRSISYQELAGRIDQCEHYEGASEHGEQYQIQFDFFFDDGESRNIRVISKVSYSGWTDFFPVSSDFIIAPDGSFVDE